MRNTSRSLTSLLKVGWQPTSRSRRDAAASPETVKPLGDELAELRRQLERAELELSSMCEQQAIVAHEVYQPLNTVKMLAQSRLRELQTAPAGAPELIEDLREIVTQVQTAARIIASMRQACGQRAPDSLVAVDVGATLKHVLKLARHDLARRHSTTIQLRERLARVPNVLVQRGAVEQVIINLLNNAFEAFSHKTCREDGEEVWVTCFSRNARFVEIQIADNAGGIPEAIRERIFEPFVSSRNEARGMGLGLSVCKRLVDRCGGQLRFEVNDGIGTTFSVALPSLPVDMR